jgi:hypothetical protein
MSRYTKMEKKENSGTKWTKEEEEKLLKSIDNNKKLEDICEEHKRNVGGIIFRLKLIVYKLYNDGKTVDEIHNTIKLLSVEEINKTIKTRENIKKKQEDSKNKKEDNLNQEQNLISVLNEIKNSLNLLVQIKLKKYNMQDEFNPLEEENFKFYETQIGEIDNLINNKNLQEQDDDSLEDLKDEDKE